MAYTGCSNTDSVSTICLVCFGGGKYSLIRAGEVVEKYLPWDLCCDIALLLQRIDVPLIRRPIDGLIEDLRPIWARDFAETGLRR